MSNADPRGQFVWHDLLTSDAAAATAFYTKVVAWKTQPWEEDPSYSMWVAKNGPVGGISALGETGAPRWLPYIGVPDMSATLVTAQSLGGRVLKEPMDLPNGGSHAVLADPQGAEFGVYEAGSAASGAPVQPPQAPGDFTWHELATSDARAAMDFYTKLFGWEAGPVNDMGPQGLYHLFLRDGKQYGGMYVGHDAPGWLCYVRVEDAGKAVAAAKAAGGRLVNGPTEVPGGSWVAQVLDSEGAAFAVHEPKMEQAATPPAAKAVKPSKPKAAKAEKPAAAAAPPAAAGKPAVAAPATAKKAPAKAGARPAAVKPAAAKPAARAAAGKAKKKAAKKAAPAKGKPAARKAAKKVAKKAAKKSAARGKAKVAAKKAAGKKQSAARRAPARKVSRAKAKKRR